ncbi:MAG: cobalamin B12-binding domain-containing protein [Burkholderiaceae bacterium]|jgi:methanogenic corrinoid protein MtbC1|nr:cobalamin B12-binding domain-containing protein [Burkholderiales bacterium]MCZ8337677.1 cobalamin B12-binding domain-containing protein [Burkholderiaceae bacterium]
MERSSEDGSTGERRGAADPHHPSASARLLFDGDAEPRLWLRRTIETEIVPRLMLAHRPNGVAAADALENDTDVLDRDDVESFTQMVLRDEVDACAGFVGALRERGIGLEQVYLGLVAPVARRLGVLWEEDACDFAQVTLGLWRLQNLVFELAPQLPLAWSARPDVPARALLAAAPGSQHTLGLLIVSEFFRRAGWDVWSDPCASEGDLAALVRSEWFDLIGLSVGMDGHVEPLRSVILGLRRASRNPDVGIMVGGPILANRPQLVSEVAADFTAADARQAVERADAFVAQRALQT